MKRLLAMLAVAAIPTLVGCGTDSGAGAGPFSLTASPEHVFRLIPGVRPMALVTAIGSAGDVVVLTATTSLADATVELRPDRVATGEVSEVWVGIPDVTEEQPFAVTVTGRRGSTEQSLTLSATAAPGVDDLEATALDIVDIFLEEYGGKIADLPNDRSGLAGGTPVAGLLVVSHYAWFTDTVEVGLSWHIMIAPDDWAELYVRPRDSLTPTHAFRLSSWTTALNGGDYTLSEITAPAEVTR